MTTGGFHLLSGLILASFIKNEKYKKAKWGLVWGSIIPDIDIFVGIIVFLITGDFNSAVFIHRSVTHGFFAMGLVILIGFIISLTKPDLKGVFLFSLAFAVGMLTHTFYDLIDGSVAILSPFTFERYSFTGFDYVEYFGYPLYSVWNAFDCMSDVLFYLSISYWAIRKGDHLKEQKFARRLTILSLISIVFFGIMMILAFVDSISYQLHFLICYAYWGFIHLPLSCIFVQLKMRETIQEFSFIDLIFAK